MRKDALKLGYDIEVDSGYRSYEYQQKIFDNLYNEKGEEAYKFVALPGTSEHQTGLAFDYCLFINGVYTDDINDYQEETKWIHNNCYKYGFILRYPKGKEDITGYNYEPWHLRYVGNEISKIIFEKNITLEEYYQLYKNNL